MKSSAVFIILAIFSYSFVSGSPGLEQPSAAETLFRAVHDEQAGTISVFRADRHEPVLVQNAQEDIRPYLHPIIAPDGRGVLTQYRPDHHTHQTGLYWGLKRVNERDYFMECCKPGETGYYQRVSANVVVGEGEQVQWQTVYNLLDEEGDVTLTETQNWSLKEQRGEFVLDLEWIGDAKTDITIGEFFVGGLFLRMPWFEGIEGEVVNASGQVNGEAEARRSVWLDTGMEIDGRDDRGHIAIFDHPGNSDFPIPWRVDGELGVGPSRQITGDWQLLRGETEAVRYRLIVYTGELDPWEMNRRWNEFIIRY